MSSFPPLSSASLSIYYQSNHPIFSLFSFSLSITVSLYPSIYLYSSIHITPSQFLSLSLPRHAPRLSPKAAAVPAALTPQTSIISMRELERIKNEATMKTEYQLEHERTIAMSLANERERNSNDRFDSSAVS